MLSYRNSISACLRRAVEQCLGSLVLCQKALSPLTACIHNSAVIIHTLLGFALTLLALFGLGAHLTPGLNAPCATASSCRPPALWMLAALLLPKSRTFACLLSRLPNWIARLTLTAALGSPSLHYQTPAMPSYCEVIADNS